jgi:hypothetical protein
MKATTASLILIAGSALLAGCGVSYPVGWIYNGTTVPHNTRVNAEGDGKAADKMGEACASGILGLAAWGDASTDAAKKAGGVSSVYTEEFRGFSILGIWQQGCTQVTGK